MPLITIAGTIIDFPDSAQAPSWAPALIQFAQAVEGALQSVVGSFDLPPQIVNIDAYNPGLSIPLPQATFPVGNVRGIDFTYSVFRQTSTQTVAEKGIIEAVYNPNGPVGNKWEASRDLTGNAQITLTIADNGQFFLTTTTLTGSNHIGTISYGAKAILQSGN